ncbi:MAG: hypothetical protein ABI673_03490 [Novosphingobium sp.]
MTANPSVCFAAESFTMVPLPTPLADVPQTGTEGALPERQAGLSVAELATVAVPAPLPRSPDADWEPLHPMHRQLHARLQEPYGPAQQAAATPAPDLTLLPGSARVAIIIGAATGSWALVLALARRAMALF